MVMPEKETPCLVAGEHVLDLLVRQGDLLDGLALILQRRIIVIDVRGQEELRVPFKALAGGKVRDLLQEAIVSSRPHGHRCYYAGVGCYLQAEVGHPRPQC